MTFSERYNIVVRRLTLQHDDMNRDLRIALWNAFCVSYYARDCRIGTYPWIQYLTAMIYGRFFRRSMVELPPYTRKVREEVRVFFLKQEWFRIYDFLEFVYSLQIDRDGRPIAALEEMAAQFSVECNRALEENLSAYRMVHGRIEEIGAEMEQSILQDLVQDVEDSFGAARRDFWSSYEYISNKSHPDVKQAVSVCLRALDAIAQKVLNDPATRFERYNRYP